MVRESVKAPLYPSDPPRVKRTHAANQMKRVQRGRCAASTCCRATLHDLPDQPQCGLRLLEPGRSPLYTQAPSCVKRTHAANQMKRVQRANGSLAQVWGAQPQRTPRGKHDKANAVTQKRTLSRRRLRSPRPSVLRRDRHKETHKPEVNQESRITAPTIRERATGDHDPNEESPESQWLFGAGLGARSPQRTPRGRHFKANMFTQKRAYAAPPTPSPASFRSPSGSP